jgi:hypothetical protein
MRSWSQNTGPLLETNRRKFAVVIWMESESRLESSFPLLSEISRGDEGAGGRDCVVAESSMLGMLKEDKRIGDWGVPGIGDVID